MGAAAFARPPPHRVPALQARHQTVFGAGRADARLLILGEQPREREDLEGRPFIGPARRMLDRALQAAGIDRGLCYLTHAAQAFQMGAARQAPPA